MDELIIASTNRGKIKEIEHLLAGAVARVYSLDEFPHLPEVVEDGETFEANAVKKARSAASVTGKPALADDSGLIVDALAGRPGVLSARFSGESATDESNNAKLLRELSGVPPDLRTGRFRCVVALCFPDGDCRTFTGDLEGVILDTPRGVGGFGYDPLFVVPGMGETLAEIPLDVKNRISHRGKALLQLKCYLDNRRRQESLQNA